MSKIKIEDIRTNVENQGWKLISEEYSNLDTEMIFECPEGHRVFAPWKRMRNKLECPTCKANEFAKKDNEILSKPANTQRILALDQASHISGYAIFDNGKLIKYGTFQASQDDEMERYFAIKSWLLSMITNWRPDFIGLEGIQFQEGSSTHRMGVTVFQTLARLQGILMETCYEQKIPFEICPTNTWRHECGVKGKTRVDKKRSMQLLVKQWYDVTVTDDESDAIGIGRYMLTKVKKEPVFIEWET